MNDDKIILQAIKVSQPLADFYITKIKAKDLLEVSFVEPLQYTDEKGNLKGSQRLQDIDRLKQIAKYINSVEMTFPNSIIIAANYSKEGKVVENDNDEQRWKIEPLYEGDNSLVRISIPKNRALAAIIDVQNRLMAFNYAESEKKEIELVCSIFFDLPNSYQAYLFATINGNQKKVDRSLALEQFGFNVEDEPEHSWTPEKLDVYFSLKLNFTPQSPLYGRIKLAPIYSEETFKDIRWYVSTSTIVDCFLALISSNPKRDRVEMAQRHILKGRSRSQLGNIKDSTPLRQYYLKNQDDIIYDVVKRFFTSVNEILWKHQPAKSHLFKTVGILALIDLLKKIVLTEHSSIETINFDKYIEQVKDIDWCDNYFSLAGTGRTRAKRVLFYANDFSIEAVQDDDLDNIKRLVRKREL
jgi:DNA phosphorothioation-associated DGQHR protein 1